MKEAFQTIETLIASKQFSKLKVDFSSCNDISHPNDTVQFVTDLAGVFTNVVQYNDETTWMDIRKVCGYMTNTYKSSYQRLMDVNKVRWWKALESLFEGEILPFLKCVSVTMMPSYLCKILQSLVLMISYF